MATLTLQQPNAKQLITDYYEYNTSSIDATSNGWYQFDAGSGVIYGAFLGTGITYDTRGNGSLGTITSASRLDDTGATQWTVVNSGIAANATTSMSRALQAGNAFSTYMVKDVLQGNDTIIGSSGNDYIWASDGSDTINGGAGNDWMFFSTSFLSYSNSLNVNLATGLYSETVKGVIISSHISNVENIVGSRSADILTGNAENNSFVGGDGDDLIDGGAGVDSVSYESRYVYGVDANLTTGIAIEKHYYSFYVYTDHLTNIENLIGSNVNDTLTGNAGNNMLTGGAGNDSLDGKSGFDTADFSTAYKSVTVNLITGTATGQGTDTLLNIEAINGSSYGDKLTGNAGANTLTGNAGNDILNGGAGNDTLIGGLDIDQANYDTATSGVTVNLAITIAQNTHGAGIDTLSGIENLLGSKFNDVFTGDGLANTLTGGLGNDTLLGGSGNDSLIGGAGKDSMTGGLGNDGFVFNVFGDTKAGINKDVIIDFVHGTDKINLAGIDADISVDGNQTFSLISSTTAFTAAGQIRFNAGILSGDVTDDGIADFQIALTGVTVLTASDFVL
jgi:Ca2+-binding RTX toxin-like protein